MLKTIKRNPLETICCGVVLLAAIGTVFKGPIQSVWEDIKLSKQYSEELIAKENKLNEIKDFLGKEVQAKKRLLTENEALKDQVSDEKSVKEMFQNLLQKEREKRVSKINPIVVEDEETAYQVWSLNRETKRQRAKDKWR